MDANCSALIVDDEEDLRDILEMICLKIGVSVQTAANGQQALDLIKKHHFDIVISDIQMPVMDGMTLLANVRQDQSVAQPKFIFITGGIDFTDEKMQIISTQTDGLLPKPFSLALILERLSGLFPDKKFKS